MRSGNLDRWVTIQEATETQDTTTGAVTSTWERKLDVAAKVRTKDKVEAFEADRIVAFSYTDFWIRYVDWLTTDKHRLLYEDELYDVVALTEDEAQGRKNFLKVTGLLRRK